MSEKKEVKSEIDQLKKTIAEREQYIADTNWKYTLGSAVVGGALAAGGIALGASLDASAAAQALEVAKNSGEYIRYASAPIGHSIMPVVGIGAGAVSVATGTLLADKVTAKARAEQKIDRDYLATVMDSSFGEREKMRAVGEEIIDRGYQGYLPQVFSVTSKRHC